MDRRWVVGVVALALVGAGLSGCQEGAAPGGSTPAATVTTVTPSPTPTEDPLFTEAKKVHLEYLEQMVLMDENGGKGAPSAEMRTLVTGEFEATLDDVYAKLRESGMHAERDAEWSRLSIRRTDSAKSHVIGISSCVDFSNIRYMNASGSVVSRGSIRHDELQFERKAGKLVIAEGSSEGVKSCNV